MKKTYITPKATAFNVSATHMMAFSMGISEQTVDTSQEGVQLTNEQTTSTNVWGEEW